LAAQSLSSVWVALHFIVPRVVVPLICWVGWLAVIPVFLLHFYDLLIRLLLLFISTFLCHLFIFLVFAFLA
jgi:hypothetical protein